MRRILCSSCGHEFSARQNWPRCRTCHKNWEGKPRPIEGRKRAKRINVKRRKSVQVQQPKKDKRERKEA